MSFFKGLQTFWRNDIKKRMMLAIKPFMNNELEDLYISFNEKEDIDQFELLTDQMFGGNSQCSLSLMEENGKRYGHLRLNQSSNAPSKCFSAMRLTFHPYDDWSQYKGIEMRLRTKGRGYMVCIKPSSVITNDLYQGYIYLPENKWFNIGLPFKDFMLTGYGYIKENQKLLDARRVDSFAISLIDPREGQFMLDIEYIKMVRNLKNNSHRIEISDSQHNKLTKDIDDDIFN